ncbi:MAG TPA: hypothetical protein VKP66_04530 [Steroidobacteraceae bacterium]|nr:hypothetical protein [Steroidobacteraceae bacterium]
MKDYILLMHNDVSDDVTIDDWGPYLAKLKETGHIEGGSAIGGGICAAKLRPAPEITAHLSGYIRIQAEDLGHAQRLLKGNPVFEGGGTIEIRELPRG